MESRYTPTGPYVFGSGRRAGKVVEVLMFKDYSFLCWLLEKMRKESTNGGKNKLQRHLEWILEKGEKLPVQSLCPHCKEKPISRISVIGNERDGYTMGFNFTCCDSARCLEKVRNMAGREMPKILPVKFSSLRKFRRGTDQEQLAKLLRSIFNVPSRMTKEVAFELFANA